MKGGIVIKILTDTLLSSVFSYLITTASSFKHDVVFV